MLYAFILHYSYCSHTVHSLFIFMDHHLNAQLVHGLDIYNNHNLSQESPLHNRLSGTQGRACPLMYISDHQSRPLDYYYEVIVPLN